MIRCFIYSQLRFLALLTWVPRALLENGWVAAFKRLIIFILGIPLFWSLQILHWFGMLMDVFFYPSWKKTKVNSPVFITGIPRSGTTYLQRTLAKDKRFTSTPTWELLFAPSVSEKIFWKNIGLYLRPLRAFLGRQKFFSKMDAIHSLKLDEPEEDFLFLLQLNACFILIALFPSAKGLWRLSRFDEALPKWERRLIMKYYKVCVQKHLYFQNILDGRSHVYLSKNPSFASATRSLQKTFKDAKFIVCARDPKKTVASQISSLKPAFELLGNQQSPEGFVEKCISMLHHYYADLNQSLIVNDSAPLLLNKEIHINLETSIKDLYNRWDWEIDADFGKFLHEQSEKSRNYQSKHAYKLSDFGLDDATIEAHFNDVWPMGTDSQSKQADAREPELRVAIVSDAAPHRNGVGAYYEDLKRHLADQVDAIMILSPTIKNGKWSGGLAVPMPGDTTQKCLIPNIFKLYRQLKDFRPTVVILPTPALYGFAGLILGKLLDAVVLTGFHTWFEKLDEFYWNQRWRKWVNQTYLKIFNKMLFSGSELVLVNSEFMVKTAKEIAKCTPKLVGTPVSYEFIHTPVSAPGVELKKVLFVGRLAPEKNLEAVIEAARALPDVHFDIAGDGPDRESIEKAAEELENLNYIGWVDRDKLLRLIDDHDILVLPSHVESFGTVALEAMARQRLALVSKNCGISEWPDLRDGLLVIDEGETLATALKRLSRESDSSRINMAEKARECAVYQNKWNLDRWKELLTYAVEQL